MTKVEELRMGLLLQVSMMQKHVELLDSLISAAEACGVEKGKAEGEERLQKYTEAYLAEGIKRCSAALAQGRAEGFANGHAELRDFKAVMEKARAEGAERERERIRGLARPLNRVYELSEGEAVILLADELDPKKAENDQG